MRSIITPDNYPDIDDETGRAQVTVPVTVTATDREDVLEFLGRLSEYETGEDKEVD